MIVVVLGMHRSGTSAVAGMLHRGGISMGGRRVFRPRPSWENPKGFFEDVRFRRMNDELLDAVGYDVKSWSTAIPTEVETSPALRRRMVRLVGRRDRWRQDWGWKDPRQCLTMAAWWEVLAEMGLTSKVGAVVVYRHPAAVARSLLRRGDIDAPDRGLALWRLYNERVLTFIRSHPVKYTVVDFNALLQEGVGYLETALDGWGIRLKGAPLRGFLDEERPGSDGEEERDLERGPETVDRVDETLEALRHLHAR